MFLENFVKVQYCYDFLIEQIPVELLLYSHIPTALTSLLFSGYVLWKVRNLASKMLFATCVSFAIWCFADLGTWFSFLGVGSTMFLWSLLDLVGVMMFFFAYYFIYSFLLKERIPKWQSILIFFSIIPIIIYTWLGLHLPTYDANACYTIENSMYTRYPYLVQLLFIVATIFVTRTAYTRSSEMTEKKRAIFAGSGVLFFLLFFFTATLSVSILSESDVSSYAYNYIIYGLFGMPILLVYLGYLIVRFKAFNIGLVASQALVLTLVVLVASQFSFSTSVAASVLTGVTLAFIGAIGIILLRSVKKEIALRKEVEALAGNLEKANVRLKQLDKQKSEFVSIASHQLRSPLTSIRGYASLLLEGSFGNIPKKAEEPLTRIAESSKLMAIAVEDYLNVSRIESGNMKYNLSDFNLRDEVEHVCDDLRADALKRGLVLIFRTDLNSRGVINADIGKTVQIVQNLIHNSIKYTQKGTVKVLVRDDIKKKKIYVDIIDTGIGMNTKTQQTIFQKFERADNANTVNTSGTGLGLYVAVKMAEAMGGGITAFSEGDGKGSRFTIEMPLAL